MAVSKILFVVPTFINRLKTQWEIDRYVTLMSGVTRVHRHNTFRKFRCAIRGAFSVASRQMEGRRASWSAILLDFHLTLSTPALVNRRRGTLWVRHSIMQLGSLLHVTRTQASRHENASVKTISNHPHMRSFVKQTDEECQNDAFF